MGLRNIRDGVTEVHCLRGLEQGQGPRDHDVDVSRADVVVFLQEVGVRGELVATQGGAKAAHTS